MDKIEQMIEQLTRTKDGRILSELNEMGISAQFLPEGIRWSYKK